MKITTQKGIDTSKALATESGQELREAIEFLADLGQQVVSILRNNVSVEDNLNSLVQEVTVKPDTFQEINTNGKIPRHAWITRSFNSSYPEAGLYWEMNSQNRMQIKVKFHGSPPATLSIRLTLMILF